MRGSKRYEGIPEEQQIAHRFMLKVSQEPNSGCWLWLGATDQHGYGLFWKDGKTRKAHVVSRELFGTDYEVGENSLHSCDVMSCVNPSHTRAGSHAENMLDMAKKGRGSRSKSGLPYGVYAFGKRFVSRVSVGGRKHLGVFDTVEEAAMVAAEAKERALRKEIEG